MKTEYVINTSGTRIDWQAAVNLMDDEIRENLSEQDFETNQDFFTAYEQAHAKKYGDERELSKRCPQY